MFQISGGAIEIFGRRIALPASRLGRVSLGCGLVLGGCLAILPFFGLWMLPLGLLVLSIDIAIVRRWRRRGGLRWTRWRQRRAMQRPASKS